jgi:hypothetical protein
VNWRYRMRPRSFSSRWPLRAKRGFLQIPSQGATAARCYLMHQHRISRLSPLRDTGKRVSIAIWISANSTRFHQRPLRRQSQQDPYSPPGATQQRYLRARAHPLRLHRKHLPRALRYDLVWPWSDLPPALVCAGHHAGCRGSQRNDICLGGSHLRHLELP